MSIQPLRVHTDAERKNPHIKPDEMVQYLKDLAVHFAILNHSEKARAYRWLAEDVEESTREATR